MLLWHRGEDEIGGLIARRKYDKAEKILRRLLSKEPESIHLRQRLADLLILKGETLEGLKVLDRLALEFDRQGFLDKALAVIKKMRRIAPEHTGLARRAIELEARREGLVWEQLRSHAPSPVESARSLGLGRPTSKDPAVVRAVRKSGLFDGFGLAEVQALVNKMKRRRYEPGDIIVSEDEQGESLYLVLSGRVKVFVRDSKARNSGVRILGEGEVFGEISVVTGRARTATITASSSAEILVLERTDLQTLKLRSPQLMDLIQGLSARRALSSEEVAARGGLGSLLQPVPA